MSIAIGDFRRSPLPPQAFGVAVATFSGMRVTTTEKLPVLSLYLVSRTLNFRRPSDSDTKPLFWPVGIAALDPILCWSDPSESSYRHPAPWPSGLVGPRCPVFTLPEAAIRIKSPFLTSKAGVLSSLSPATERNLRSAPAARAG